MVKKLSDLYLDARKALMQTEDRDTASFMARNLLCHFSGKSQEKRRGLSRFGVSIIKTETGA